MFDVLMLLVYRGLSLFLFCMRASDSVFCVFVFLFFASAFLDCIEKRRVGYLFVLIFFYNPA